MYASLWVLRCGVGGATTVVVIDAVLLQGFSVTANSLPLCFRCLILKSRTLNL